MNTVFFNGTSPYPVPQLQLGNVNQQQNSIKTFKVYDIIVLVVSIAYFCLNKESVKCRPEFM